MKLTLKTPWDPGMNDPGVTYPEIYITQMTDNPSAGNFSFIYEAGSFQNIGGQPDINGNITPISSVWIKGPGNLSQMATVSGEDYLAAQNAPILQPTDSAYQSIRRILYMKLIGAGLDGEIVDT